jgi:hypothetical protein
LLQNNNLLEAVIYRQTLSAAAKLNWRKNAPWPDHQSGQSGDPQVAGAGGHVDVFRADGWNSAVGAWLRSVLERRPVRLVTVALANKMARIAWSVMTRKEVYRPKGGVAAVAQATA